MEVVTCSHALQMSAEEYWDISQAGLFRRFSAALDGTVESCLASKTKGDAEGNACIKRITKFTALHHPIPVSFRNSSDLADKLSFTVTEQFWPELTGTG